MLKFTRSPRLADDPILSPTLVVQGAKKTKTKREIPMFGAIVDTLKKKKKMTLGAFSPELLASHLGGAVHGVLLEVLLKRKMSEGD